MLLWQSASVSEFSLSTTVAGTLNHRAFSLYSQLRGQAAATVGMLVCGVNSLFSRVGVTLECAAPYWGCLQGVMGQELLWRDLAEVGGLDGVGLQGSMRVGHLVLVR